MPVSSGAISGTPISAAPAGGVPAGGSRAFSLGGIGAPCCCGGSNCCQTTCSPCQVPQKDLQLAYTNIISGNGTCTLYYTGSNWESDCTNGLTYRLLCNAGQVELRVIYYTTGSCPSGAQQYCSNLRSSPYVLTLSASACTPLSLTFTSTSMGCPTITNSGYTMFVVTDPDPVDNPPGLMCQNFAVGYCQLGQLAGATVTVYTSMGGTLVASGTTNSVGGAHLWWQGTPGPYYVEVTATDIPTYTATLSLACGGSTNISMYNASDLGTLVGTTLNFTDAHLGVSGTATWNSSTNTWTGTASYSYPVSCANWCYPGYPACSACTVTLTYSLSAESSQTSGDPCFFIATLSWGVLATYCPCGPNPVSVKGSYSGTYDLVTFSILTPIGDTSDVAQFNILDGCVRGCSAGPGENDVTWTN